MPIRHFVVLMLENRSFDAMLGALRPAGAAFDGLTGAESNVWHQPGGAQQRIFAWNDPALDAAALCIPDPDPGELFADIDMQLRGLAADGSVNPGGPTMGGFVDNYMRQPAAAPAADPRAVMHHFTPAQLPVLSTLAQAFAVSDRWFAAAPCQTWPNRFFVHTGTAGGYVNNAPTHFPYEMPTVFNRLSDAGASWRIYFHDVPQAAALARLWGDALTGHFVRFADAFAQDAANGSLPAYSFIEPRYFTAALLGDIPNDAHPPHNVAFAEQLVATVYNALRGGPNWRETLLLVIFDEHGGCHDHVVPPAAVPPDGLAQDGFAFDRFGVRVPAVIVSPLVPAGSVLRPAGPTPFDHTSVIATLRRLHGFAPLTARDAAAPDLLAVLGGTPDNDGPAIVAARAVAAAPGQVAQAAARPPNDLQRSLAAAAVHLPTAGADVATHLARLRGAVDVMPQHATVADAAADVAAHVRGFLGR